MNFWHCKSENCDL